jgi:hypothetical protein
MEFEKLQNIIAKILDIDVDDISMNMKLIDDLGVDSLDLFQIIMELEEEFDIEISNAEAQSIITIADAVERIKSKIN